MYAPVSNKHELLGSERGFALLAVFWIILLLSILALGYASSTRLRAVTADNQVHSLKNNYLFQSAQTMGRQAYAVYESNLHLFRDSDEYYQQTGKKLDLWYPRFEPFVTTINDTSLAVSLRAESGRFDVNKISLELWSAILKCCGVDDEARRTAIINSVLDWSDSDSAHRISGAEQKEYDRHQPAYYCANTPISALAQLLLVKNITPALYYGSGDQPGLISFLSQYGSEKKLDINSADPKCFALIETLSSDEIDAILRYRKSQPFMRMAQLADLVSSDNLSQLNHYFSVDSGSYITVAVSTWPTRQSPLLWQHTTRSARELAE